MTLSWQEEVRRRLRERRERAAKEPPKVSRPPRYDDVYFEGLTQLNVKANKQANKPSILDILKEAEMSEPTIKVESSEERADKAEAEVERLRADMSDLRFDRDLQRAKVNQLIASGRDCDREWADRAIERERSLQAEMERLHERNAALNRNIVELEAVRDAMTQAPDPYRERVEALEALLVCDGTSILEDRVKDLIEVRDALKEAAKHQRLRAEKAEAELADLVRFRPFSEYGDDDGDVLWWALPVCEPPFFLGAPSNIGWPWTEEPPTNVYWTPLPKLTSDGSEIRGEA